MQLSSWRYILNPCAPLTPEQAMERLIEGNKRFTGGCPAHPHADSGRRGEVLNGQNPFAVILTCSDSRVPPEIVFDCGIGDIFVVRVAGNIIDTAAMGSIVYAVTHLDCPLVVVLGHESCGAVTAALAARDNPPEEHPSMDAILKTIRENIPNTLNSDGEDRRLESAVRENAAAVAGQIEADDAVRDRAAGGATSVKAAYYSLQTGEVVWL